MTKPQIQSLQEIFRGLKEALERRKCIINVSADTEYSFKVFHPNYAERMECIRIDLGNAIIAITICRYDTGYLPSIIKDAIMQKHGKHFEVHEEGGVLMLIREAEAYRDIDDIANILMQAYGIAVTTKLESNQQQIQ